MIPISDVVPLATWIPAYHHFRFRLNTRLMSSGLSLIELHQQQLGAEDRPWIWRTSDYTVIIEGRALSFEIPEMSSVEKALSIFELYQKKLFDP
jgi:hypothetical protein